MMPGRSADSDLVKIGVWPVSGSVPRPKKNEVNYSNNTIDGVPLRKLYVRNVPAYVKREQLYPVFSPFGVVENIDVHKQQGQGPSFRPRVFVTYKFSKDAVKALNQKSVQLFGRHRLYLNPAFAYLQPSTNDDSSDEEETLDCDTTAISESSLVAFKPNTDAPPIENLDDYCIRHIFSFLPHMERVKMEGVCRRWKSIARGMWRMEGQLDLANGIPFKLPKKYHSLLVLKQIFKRCGASLKKLNLQGVDIFGADGLIEAIMLKCLALEDLRLQGQHLNGYKINMLKPLKNLKVLALRDCNPVKDYNLIALLEDKSQLTHLEVTCSQHINGSFLQSINSPLETLNLSSCEELCSSYLLENLGKYSSTLKHLYISNCQTLDLDEVNDILKLTPGLQTLMLSHYPLDSSISLNGIASLKHLESLNVSFNRNISGEFLKLLARSAHKLRHLDISGSDIDEDEEEDSSTFCISNLNMLKSLRSLNLSYVGTLDGEIIRKYASKSPPIESLQFSGCVGLEDDDIKSLFSSCHQLKHLDLSGCAQITEETLKAASEAVSLRTNNQPLHLIVGDTKIKDPSRSHSDSELSNQSNIEESESNNELNKNSESKSEPYHPLLSVSYESTCSLDPQWLYSIGGDGFFPTIALGNFDDWFDRIMENEIYFDSDDVSDFFDVFDSDDEDDDYDDEDFIDEFCF